MFVSDYRPTKRIGIEELDGAIKLFGDRYLDAAESGEADATAYGGASLVLELIRNGKFEYPQDLLAVFENKLKQTY